MVATLWAISSEAPKSVAVLPRTRNKAMKEKSATRNPKRYAILRNFLVFSSFPSPWERLKSG